ncbi:phosphate ABC transporter substrate-binding protein [Marinobacter panjinensis]|uniref:Phosphate ABC transporter substrate-binding protein n=1 Tax=Marinobacter panjinensis TaxID=2576384 RepID=A0A4U6R6V1_9GAMM|nr:phosphate ABC transporter substrate-binding protein [Marinobacter panjinensis]MCR8914546.1 phosphate ABC transporter substrate-binding protein [Marinobacter panjinensis]TKV68632.1 phosphate ABC transporter substrate-binding protein [Marinobacter panjinensis]
MNKQSLIILASLLLSPLAMAEVVVIGHPAGPDSISSNQVRDIYLNRSQQLPDGQKARAFELPEGNSARSEFHDKVTGRNDAQLKAFWSQQVFTGRGQPPEEQGNAAAIKARVLSTPGSIGYLDAADVDATVKVILTP